MARPEITKVSSSHVPEFQLLSPPTARVSLRIVTSPVYWARMVAVCEKEPSASV